MDQQLEAIEYLYISLGAVGAATLLLSFIVSTAVFCDTEIIRYARRMARREARTMTQQNPQVEGIENPIGPQHIETPMTGPALPAVLPAIPGHVQTRELARTGSLPPPYAHHDPHSPVPQDTYPHVVPTAPPEQNTTEPVQHHILPTSVDTSRPYQRHTSTLSTISSNMISEESPGHTTSNLHDIQAETSNTVIANPKLTEKEKEVMANECMHIPEYANIPVRKQQSVTSTQEASTSTEFQLEIQNTHINQSNTGTSSQEVTSSNVITSSTTATTMMAPSRVTTSSSQTIEQSDSDDNLEEVVEQTSEDTTDVFDKTDENFNCDHKPQEQQVRNDNLNVADGIDIAQNSQLQINSSGSSSSISLNLKLESDTEPSISQQLMSDYDMHIFALHDEVEINSSTTEIEYDKEFEVNRRETKISTVNKITSNDERNQEPKKACQVDNNSADTSTTYGDNSQISKATDDHKNIIAESIQVTQEQVCNNIQHNHASMYGNQQNEVVQVETTTTGDENTEKTKESNISETNEAKTHHFVNQDINPKNETTELSNTAHIDKKDKNEVQDCINMAVVFTLPMTVKECESSVGVQETSEIKMENDSNITKLKSRDKTPAAENDQQESENTRASSINEEEITLHENTDSTQTSKSLPNNETQRENKHISETTSSSGDTDKNDDTENAASEAPNSS